MIVHTGKGILDFRLSIHRLNEIRPHEEVIPELLRDLIMDMRRTRHQRDPLIVDAKTLVALDGMHRLAALKKLGAKYAMCADFDYSSSTIKLERWLRYVIAPSNRFIRTLISQLRMEQCSDIRSGISLVDSGYARIALLSSAESYVQRVEAEVRHAEKEEDDDISEPLVFSTYRQVKKFDTLCSRHGLQIRFASPAERRSIFSSESTYMLYPEAVTKHDVLAAAECNQVFPFKTTRHTLPARPMGVYFPLKALKGNRREDCENILERIISLSKVEISTRNQWYEGRQYGEPLAIFRRGNQSHR